LLLRVGAGGDAAEKRSHLVSDHLVLGASLMAILTTELGLGVADLKRAVAGTIPEVARIACTVTGQPPIFGFLDSICIGGAHQI